MNLRFASVIAVAVFALSSARLQSNPVPVDARASLAIGALHPAVSPDGRMLAVSYQGAIGVVPVAGGTLRILTHEAGWDIHPAWSPDGRRMAFIRSPNFMSGQLHIIDVADGRPVAVTPRTQALGPVTFHPDGRIFGKLSPGGYPTVVSSYDPDTGKVAPVDGYPDDWGTRRGAFALSGDGRWIYFNVQADVAGQQGGNNGPQCEVCRMPSGGGAVEKLLAWPARIYQLAVAAGGDALFVATDRGTAHNDVWRLPLAAPLAAAEKLTMGVADEDCPVAMPGGDSVGFTDNRAGATALVVQDLATGRWRELSIDWIDYGRPTKRMRLLLSDIDGPGTAARVSVQRRDGGFFAPPGAMYHLTAGLGHFVHRGDLDLELPVGDYQIRVFRGPEYHPDHTSITLHEHGDVQIVHPAVTRWTDTRARGWYSGENHIHANYGYGEWYNDAAAMAARCEAEDLHVANLVIGNSDGEAVFDREFFSGGADPRSTAKTLLWWNEEFRSTIWGHMTLFHLRRVVEPVFTGFARTTNPLDVPTNADIARQTHRQGGALGYTHPSGNAQDSYDQPYSAKGLPVDAALGFIDCLDVMGNVYDATLPFWYRLLNAGHRLPAAAGTDCFLNRLRMSPAGWGRVYVKVDGDFSYGKWVEGVKRGRSFVSNGPVLEFTVDDRLPGESIHLDAPGMVRVKGAVQAAYPLAALELIQNGKVIAGGEMAEDGRSGSIAAQVEVAEGGWLALRASGRAVQHLPGRTHAAHSNPVYLQVKGGPQDTSEAATYFLKWIDRLEADLVARDRIPPAEWPDVRRHLDLARAVYRSRLKGFSGVVR